MPRPYQHLRRAEIAELLQENQQERDRLQAISDRLDAEADAISGEDVASIRRRMPLVHQSTEATKLRIALLEQVQDINFELHVRDTPELVAEFGPGAD